MSRATACLILCLGCVLVVPVGAQDLADDQVESVSEQLDDPRSADVRVAGNIVEPRQLSDPASRLEQLRMPAGFSISVFAQDLVNPRMIAVHRSGTVYVTSRKAGDVLMLRDEDGDGRADRTETVANRPQMHGIAIEGDTVYLVTVHDLYRATIQSDGRFGPLEHLIDDLPDAGQHPNRTLVVGPDGQLYLSVGSTCNACNEPNPENAALLQVAPDGSSRTIFASGLRNLIGFGFHPQSGHLYGFDHGIDWLGDNEQHEELNRIEKGNKYGWPYVFDDGRFNPQDEPPEGISMEEWAARSVNPLGFYTPHAAPMQWAFYTGSAFPEEYQGDAFVAMRGSWNRRPPSGYEVVRVRFEGGEPAEIAPFITGFLTQDGDGWGHYGRLAGLAEAPDGALLLSDDANGIIYRIAHTGADGTGSAPAPTNAEGARIGMIEARAPAPPEDTPSELAAALLQSEASLEVTSPAFAHGDWIPHPFAADSQNISPPLNWTPGPGETQSYALIMEDPDVEQDPPFVHWILYNIPPDVTALQEGIPNSPILPRPNDALQGANDRGSTGYYGPRPPRADPAHAYHFQVFALDGMLSLPHGATRAEFLEAIQGRVLAQGTLVGTYER